MEIKSKGLRITGLALKIFAVAFIVAINVLLFMRMFTTGNPSSMKQLMIDENTLAAYERLGQDFESELFTQKQDVFTTAERNYAYFAITDVVFIPSANQLQIVFRYNNSTLEAVAEDYNLGRVPDRAADVFDVTVVKTVDITPDDKEDNAEGEGIEKSRIYPSAVISDTKNMHNYRKFIFNDITSDDAEGIFVDIYYVDDVNYDELSYGTLCVYNCESTNIPYELGRASEKALEEALANRK